MKKKVLVSGCNGKMGKLVCSAVNSSKDMYVVAGFDKTTSITNFPVYSGNCYSIFREMKNQENLPDIIIDFSSPEATRDLALHAANFGIPIVIATTGLTPDDLYVLKNEYSSRIPVFQSANMSFDVALFKNIVQLVAKQLANTDIEISETHHNRKKDAPSGTAKMLADAINDALRGTKTIIYGREGAREKNEIGLSSIRGGNIAGEHTVHFFSENETLEIKHTAYSRDVFADGAVQAARFLLTKEAGFYNMDDLISM